MIVDVQNNRKRVCGYLFKCYLKTGDPRFFNAISVIPREIGDDLLKYNKAEPSRVLKSIVVWYKKEKDINKKGIYLDSIKAMKEYTFHGHENNVFINDLQTPQIIQVMFAEHYCNNLSFYQSSRKMEIFLKNNKQGKMKNSSYKSLQNYLSLYKEDLDIFLKQNKREKSLKEGVKEDSYIWEFICDREIFNHISSLLEIDAKEKAIVINKAKQEKAVICITEDYCKRNNGPYKRIDTNEEITIEGTEVTLDSYWRRRLEDAKIDGNFELVKYIDK